MNFANEENFSRELKLLLHRNSKPWYCSREARCVLIGSEVRSTESLEADVRRATWTRLTFTLPRTTSPNKRACLRTSDRNIFPVTQRRAVTARGLKPRVVRKISEQCRIKRPGGIELEYLKQGYMQFRFRGFRGGYKESHRAVRRRDSKQIHRCEKDKVKSRELWVNNFAMIRLSTFCITDGRQIRSNVCNGIAKRSRKVSLSSSMVFLTWKWARKNSGCHQGRDQRKGEKMKSGRKERVSALCEQAVQEVKRRRTNEPREIGRSDRQTDRRTGRRNIRTDGQADGQQSARTDRDRRTDRQTGNRRRELMIMMMIFFFTTFTTRAGKENWLCCFLF